MSDEEVQYFYFFYSLFLQFIRHYSKYLFAALDPENTKALSNLPPDLAFKLKQAIFDQDGNLSADDSALWELCGNEGVFNYLKNCLFNSAVENFYSDDGQNPIYSYCLTLEEEVLDYEESIVTAYGFSQHQAEKVAQYIALAKCLKIIVSLKILLENYIAESQKEAMLASNQQPWSEAIRFARVLQDELNRKDLSPQAKIKNFLNHYFDCKKRPCLKKPWAEKLDNFSEKLKYWFLKCIKDRKLYSWSEASPDGALAVEVSKFSYAFFGTKPGQEIVCLSHEDQLKLTKGLSSKLVKLVVQNLVSEAAKQKFLDYLSGLPQGIRVKAMASFMVMSDSDFIARLLGLEAGPGAAVFSP